MGLDIELFSLSCYQERLLLQSAPAEFQQIRTNILQLDSSGTDLQLGCLEKAGCERSQANRPELAKALEFARPCGTIVVWELDLLHKVKLRVRKRFRMSQGWQRAEAETSAYPLAQSLLFASLATT